MGLKRRAPGAACSTAARAPPPTGAGMSNAWLAPPQPPASRRRSLSERPRRLAQRCGRHQIPSPNPRPAATSAARPNSKRTQTSPDLPPSLAGGPEARATARDARQRSAQCLPPLYTGSKAFGCFCKGVSHHVVEGIAARWAQLAGSHEKKAKAKAGSTQRSSRAVPHPSTNRALRRLTSEVGRDPVHSTRYGRQRELRFQARNGASMIVSWHRVLATPGLEPPGKAKRPA